jgi:hypothetical protein
MNGAEEPPRRSQESQRPLLEILRWAVPPDGRGAAMTFEQITDLFGARREGVGYKALCPAHADKNPSLAINERDGKILLKCMAGCDTKDVLAARGLTFPDLNNGKNGGGQLVPKKIEAAYDYRDEKGQLLFQVVRYEPKAFRQRQPDGKGGWIWNTDGVRRTLYNAAAIAKADSVLVVEGEKDVESARKHGIIATCNPGGAGKWRDEYSELLRGKHITIIPDSDEPGRKHAEEIAKSLHLKAASIKICTLPEPLKDLSQWPFSDAALLDLIEEAAPWSSAGECTDANLAALIDRGAEQRIAEAPIELLRDMPEGILDGRLGEICENRMGAFPRAYVLAPI